MQISKKTNIPRSTCYRIFTGEVHIDNIPLINAEKLNDYYINIKDRFIRENVLKLIESEISPLRISKATNIPRSTCYRIINGEMPLDNITLKNAEKLSEYYEKNVKVTI